MMATCGCTATTSCPEHTLTPDDEGIPSPSRVALGWIRCDACNHVYASDHFGDRFKAPCVLCGGTLTPYTPEPTETEGSERWIVTN